MLKNKSLTDAAEALGLTPETLQKVLNLLERFREVEKIESIEERFRVLKEIRGEISLQEPVFIVLSHAWNQLYDQCLRQKIDTAYSENDFLALQACFRAAKKKNLPSKDYAAKQFQQLTEKSFTSIAGSLDPFTVYRTLRDIHEVGLVSPELRLRVLQSCTDRIKTPVLRTAQVA